MRASDTPKFSAQFGISAEEFNKFSIILSYIQVIVVRQKRANVALQIKGMEDRG
jgi:hypothetical protein